MTDFKTLKKSTDSIDRLSKEIEKINNPQNQKTVREEDARYLKIPRDKAGNAFAVIRFLPSPPVDGDQGLPWVRYWDHGIENKETGQWYIERSLTTLNEKDPVSEYNSAQWNSVSNDDSPVRQAVRDRKRRLHHISNVLVVSYPRNPDLEGKVMLFEYGKKIFGKIQDCFRPPFDTQGRTPEDKDYNPTNAFDPFDLWKGANFRLTMRTVQKFPNYDASTWDVPGPISDDEAKLEKIWKSEHSLLAEVARDKFKTYDELKQKFDRVMGFTPRNGPLDGYQRKTEVESLPKTLVEEDVPPFDIDEDDDLKNFRALADG